MALFAGLAVALSGIAASLVCSIMMRSQMRNQIDASLESTVQQVVALPTERTCRQEAPPPEQEFVSKLSPIVQLVSAEGSRCWLDGRALLPVSQEARQIAQRKRAPGFQDVTGHGGMTYRMYTSPVRDSYGQQLALSVGRPWQEVENSLLTLSWVMAGVSGAGALISGAAGLWVARTSLKPMNQTLTTVEQISRTQDLAVMAPEEGADEIARFSRSFNKMTRALAESRLQQARLISDAGHELRTPLTALRTNAQLLAYGEEAPETLPSAERKRVVSALQKQTAELAELIGDLQQLSREDASGNVDRSVPLHAITKNALSRARLRGPQLTFTETIEPWYVDADPAALERAVMNVLDNAVKFSPPNGIVSVSLQGGELQIQDEGPGISPQDLPYVFERFWRSPEARSLPGTGLGLSIVAHTVEQTGGTVEIGNAEPGPGTKVLLRFPSGSRNAPKDDDQA
ncbi:sensor histidine kinase [Streptomyces erythrochromogenes]|uniref:sensor histidine kinase n=1 Tax=Streptomyces erythrochromogenes TaxID=285574 RepID=UPI0036C21790